MTTSVKHTVLRAFSDTRIIPDKTDPSKKHGFQTCGIVKGEGRVEEFEQYFNPKESAFFLAPGDYEVQATGLFLDRNRRLQLGREFTLVKSAQKSAAAA